MSTIDIEPERIGAILLLDGWHRGSSFSLQSVSSPLKWTDGYRFREMDGTWLYGPVGAVLGVRSSFVQTAEEREAEQASKRQLELAQFVWLHYATPEVFNKAVEKQSGRCAKCGLALGDFPVTHFNEADGKVYCGSPEDRGCSPLRARFGTPS